MKHHSQSGNVFFLILAAVAMFAALAWAFTQGSRQSASGLTSEQARLAAQEIIAYGNTVSDAIQKLRLRGCGETQFDFFNTIWKRVNDTDVHPSGHNPTAASGCSLFSTSDGKVAPIVFSRSYFSTVALTATQVNYGSAAVISVNLPATGDTGKAELVFQIPHLTRDICVKINEIVGVQNPGSEPPAPANTGFYVAYSSSYRDTDVVTDASGSITGKTVHCISDPATAGEYRFNHVVFVR